MKIYEIVSPLLAWYDNNARTLPWRENTEPYRIWVSEIMLQQTQVETVKPYFERFIRQFPNIESLANAKEEQILKLWEGLGYYSRARNMQKAARIVMDKYNGRFPDSYDEIISLPGIGSYTAGAIASISFGQPVPAVDGNVLRVIARLTGCTEDINDLKVKNKTTELLREIYPTSRSGDFTQSLMELGAMVCLPKGLPKCDNCPIHSLCKAYQTGTQLTLPVKSKKKPRKKEQKTVFLFCFDDKVAVRQREMSGLLGGLWEFPNVEGRLNDEEAKSILKQWEIPFVKMIEGMTKKHVFTHIEWDIKSYVIVCRNMTDKFLWVTKEMLTNEMALPTAFRPFQDMVFEAPRDSNFLNEISQSQ